MTARSLPGLAQLEQPLHPGVLRAVVDTGDGALEPGDHELARRIVAQPVTGVAPPRERKAAEDAAELYRYFEKKGDGTNFAPAFNALLGPFDEGAKAVVLKLLQSKMPAARADQDNWFEPYMGKLDPHLRDRYQKMAKNLKRGLVFGNPHSVIGLLCACFDFALNDKNGIDGVFKSIRDSFRLPGSRKLLDRLTQVNDFRNTYVAHHEKELNDKTLAERNLKHWVETLALLRI